MGPFSRNLLSFAKFCLRVVINLLGEDVPPMEKRRSKSSKTQQQTNHESPWLDQTTKDEIERMRRENKDLRRELTKKKLEHAHQCKLSRKDGRLTSSWSETLDRTCQSNVANCSNCRTIRCSSFENEAVSLISFDSGLSSIMDVDEISLDSFVIINLPTAEIPASVHKGKMGLNRATTSNEAILHHTVPNISFDHEATSVINVDQEFTVNISVGCETSLNISVDHEMPSNISVDHEMPSNISVDHETPSNINMDHETPSNISVDHETPSNINMDHETPSNTNVDHEMPSNTNVDHEANLRKETTRSDWTNVHERDDLLKELQLAQEDNDRLRQYINDVSFIIMDSNPSLFEK